MSDPLHVIVVSDRDDDAHIVTTALEREVEHLHRERVGNADELAAVLADRRWDVVLVREPLPDGGSLGAIRRAHENDPLRPIIVIADDASPRTAIELLANGADDCVKADAPEELGTAIAHAIAAADRRRASGRADEESQRVRQILDNTERLANVGGWSIDTETGEIEVSAQWMRIHGVSRRRLRADQLWELAHEDDFDAIRSALEAAREEASSYDITHRIVRQDDGEVRWVRARGEVERGPDGRVVRINGAAQDITERKLTEQRIRASEQQYRMLADNTLDVIWVMDLEERFIYVNPAVTEMTGEAPEEWIGTRLADHFGAQQLAVLRNILANNLAKGPRSGGIVFDTELRHRDGTAVPVEVRARVLHDDEAKPYAVQGVTRDMTERHDAEQRLQAQLRFRQVLLDAIPVPVFYKDVEGRYRGCNSTFAEFFGVSKEDLPGKTVFDVAPEELAEIYRDQDLELLSEGGVQRYESRARATDGELRDVVFHKATYRGDDGEVAGLIGAVIDLTDLKRQEKLFRRAQRMEALGQLAAGVAHDFNNQLQVILGYVDILLTGGPHDAEVRECAEQIQRAAIRAHSTTDHLLSYSRQQLLAPSEVDVADLLRGLADPVGRMIGEDIELVVDVPQKLPHIHVDRSGLEQAVMNLAVNARDAMPAGGRLTLRARDGESAGERGGGGTADSVWIEVADTGEGMDAEERERACKPFFTTKERGKGTGLGLSMIHGFIEQSGGALRIDSEPGAGTVVRLRLPRGRSDAEKASPGAVAKPSGGASRADATLLVVEDDDGVRGYLVRLLEREGYRVVPAAGSAEALAQVEQGGLVPDLVVTDLVMPQMRGDELVARLRNAFPDLPALAVTGYAGANVSDLEVLPKPIRGDRLLARVHELLR